MSRHPASGLCPGRSAARSEGEAERSGALQTRDRKGRMSLWRSRISGAPLRAERYALHRIRDTTFGYLLPLFT